MRFFLFAILSLSMPILASDSDICGNSESKSFISTWKDGNHSIDTLSALYGSDVSVQNGSAVYNGDLNDDGNNDVIFESSSRGSSGDSTFDILIKCYGFYRFAGGDYFAKVEVIEDKPQSTYKNIRFFSYKRDGQSNIIYKGKVPLTTPYIWTFNPETGRYEGGQD